jgi:hypothetical protein
MSVILATMPMAYTSGLSGALPGVLIDWIVGPHKRRTAAQQ